MKRTLTRALVGATAAALLFGAGVTPATAAPVTTIKMVLWPGPEGDAMQKVVNRYNSGQGKKDGVKVQMILLSRTDTFAKEATLMKARSKEWDVYFTASYLVAQHAPYLQPLQGVVQKRYLPAAVKSLQVNGAQYALPLDTSLHFLYYRKDLVDALLADKAAASTFSAIAQKVVGKALTPKDPSTWTWDDALATSAYFSKKYNPNSPTEYGFALQAKNLLYNTMLWNDVLWGLGGNWVDKSGKPAINTPAGRAAIDVYRNIYTKGLTSPDSTQWEYAEANAAMTSGKAAIYIQWNAAFGELNDPAKSPITAGKIGIAPPPGQGARTHVHALAVAMNKFGANKAATQKWMRYLGTEAAMTEYAKGGGAPSMPNVLKGMVASNPSYAQVIEYATKYGYSEPKVKREFDIYAKLAEVLSPAWTGSMTAADAAKAADAAIAPMLKG